MKKTLLFACILAGSDQGQKRLQPGLPLRQLVGLPHAPNGSLFITDDTGGTIWRISYRAAPR